MDGLIAYYGKFSEEKRLKSQYGKVEWLTTLMKIREVIGGRQGLRILDIGAGTGAYALPLAEEGHDVTAVELVPYHLGILRQKAERAGLSLTLRQGNALDLSKIPDGSFDVVLLFGPLYHLFTKEDKVRALTEAARKLDETGMLFAGYVMNEYAVLKYGFLEGHIRESFDKGKLGPGFRVLNTEEDLFSFDRLSDMDEYRKEAGLTLIKRFSQDGPTHYFRQTVTEMDEETFSLYMEYHLATCERGDLIGAGCHTAEILAR
ncbi:MAG: class I SAM-dependent methyltransferase [Lachnospiraceae bacterium]|nr:class I SAM-dependent methyltransferase [Lachnospiraceae bacterium]